MAVVACPVATLGTGLQGAAIQHRRPQLGRTVLDFAQQPTQIVHQRFKDAGLEPAEIAYSASLIPSLAMAARLAYWRGMCGLFQPPPSCTLLMSEPPRIAAVVQ